MNRNKQRIVFADVETTGIRPDNGAQIWELALIVRDENVDADTLTIQRGEDREYLWHIRPDLEHADPVALKIGGYYQRCKAADRAIGDAEVIAHPDLGTPGGEVRKAFPYAWTVARFVAGLLDGAHLVAANPHFDGGHLDAFARAHGHCLTVDYHYTDIASLVRGWAAADQRRGDGLVATRFPLKLHQAAQAVGIDPFTGYQVHSALDDARLLRDVFDAVIWRREP